MTALIDDTGLLLRLDLPDPKNPAGATVADNLLENISTTVIAAISLRVKAAAYDTRVSRILQQAHDAGVELKDLADASGLALEEVRHRLDRDVAANPATAPTGHHGFRLSHTLRAWILGLRRPSLAV